MSPAEDQEPTPLNLELDEVSALSPLMAMNLAIQAATEAAQARLDAKARARKRKDPEDEEALEIIAATSSRPVEPEPEEEPTGIQPTFYLTTSEDIDTLIAELERTLPDAPSDEVHGDLVIKRSEEKVRAWYDLAAEDALPAALRTAPGPIDVKRLLTALLVEVGDIKRTNAILMEQLTRIEEKLDRNNRLQRQQRLL
jgi:hypothetical protein